MLQGFRNGTSFGCEDGEILAFSVMMAYPTSKFNFHSKNLFQRLQNTVLMENFSTHNAMFENNPTYFYNRNRRAFIENLKLRWKQVEI